jgi:undecaprenyl-diphosphatase
LKLLRLFLLLLVIQTGFINLTLAQNPDMNLLKEIHNGREKSWDPFYRQVSLSGYWLSISYPLSTLGRGYFQKDTLLWQRGLEEVAGSGLTVILTFGLKQSIQRKRPFAVSSDIHPPPPLPDRNSFPSGHTSAAFATATHITMAWPKWYVAMPAYGWAGWVAYSRLRAGYHYPSDVLAGAVLGAGCAWAGHKATRWLAKKKKKKLLRPF